MILALVTAALAAPSFSFGGTFTIKGAHALSATADACTYGILPYGSTLCAGDLASSTVTARGRLPSTKAGGALVVTTVPTHLTAEAHDERDTCGLADAKTEGAHTMTYTAVGTPDAVVAEGAIVASHIGSAVEADWQDPLAIDPDCHPQAGGDSVNETSGQVSIAIPFRVEVEGTYVLSLEAANLGATSDWTWNELTLRASAAGMSCTVTTAGTSMDTCTQVAALGVGVQTLTVTVEHSSGMMVDSEENPSELFPINDLFTASVTPLAK
jgi:hypothetical protein